MILADEPTGALDSHSGEEVMAILHQLKAQGHTVIIVTHDPQVAAQAERIVEIRDGEIVRNPPASRRAADCAPVRRRSLRRGVSLPAAFAKRW
nr:Macrolide export ATP-binding/permease protein MacB [Klebsiella pneumoniae]